MTRINHELFNQVNNYMSQAFIPYGRQDIDQNDIESVIRVLRSDFITQGPTVGEFEKSISKMMGVEYSVACNSATSSLHLACLALGLQEGDYLWTTPITFVASANCGLYCNAKVDFVDIDPKTGLMSVKELSKKLEEAKAKRSLPKIVIPVHLAGTSCDMPKIAELSKKYGFSIIEDASHAIGGYCNNYPVGSCKYSDITIFSMHPVKIITSGEGGIATTKEESLAIKIKSLRNHGIIRNKEMFVTEPAGEWSYEQQDLGYNYRMTDILAALGLSQLQKLNAFIEKRTHIIQEYKLNMVNLPVQLLEVPENIKSAYHLAVIRLKNNDKTFHRNVFNKLKGKGIGVQVHYTPVHLQPYYRNLGFSEGDFPISENYSTNAISLPIYPTLKKQDFNRVIGELKEVLS